MTRRIARSPLAQVWRIMAQGAGMRRAFALAALVLIAGAGLLALSGWFITAAAAAGLAGLGARFDVFRPGAAVRGLAILRTAARYGERWFGHDATLRGIVRLRSHVLSGLARADWRGLAGLRRGPALARVVSDTEVLDGLPLRLVQPAIAGAAALACAAALLLWLTNWEFALWICGAHVIGAAAAALWALPRAGRLAARQVAAEQAFRTAALDLVAARDDLAVYGRLAHARLCIEEAEARARALTAAMDRIERATGLALDLTRGAAAAGALGLGSLAVSLGAFDQSLAAMGFFLAIALGEVTAPLRRAVADYGRISDAATRVAVVLEPAPQVGPPDTGLPASALPLAFGGLRLGAGQMLAVSGPSGIGKSTLLARIAGVLPEDEGQPAITLGGLAPALWPEDALRAAVTLVLQRPAVIGGSLRDNLALAKPDADDAAMTEALRICRLDHLRGGLDLVLGDGGKGLSGGERRRLALARAVLRRPALLLLDEPTEGLDAQTAAEVLRNLRAALPRSAVVIATHRRGDILTADFTLDLG